MCGNFAETDPTQQSWTAQAEPSSMLSALKLGRSRKWLTSKHDVKGAFLNAKIPENRVVIVAPPEQWVRWGLVKKGVFWTLDKAVYGLRESPFLWGQERDRQLAKLRWSVSGKKIRLYRSSSDSQVWMIKRDDEKNNEILGIMIVYVDDFLLQAPTGPIRDTFLKSLSVLWTLAKEEVLSHQHSIVFLGIEIEEQSTGD